MNAKELKTVNLSILAISFKLKALEVCLTPDQKIKFEASLQESKTLVRDTLAKFLSPEELYILLQGLDPL
ncbi:MAG: hypothetical protein ABIP27_11595 [Flavobacterium circumlabens]|uniref:hypothetical protein n=1 Tax=Flavobacterium circumlabens TaxID=2133765 RepID=UPI0032634653